MTEFPFIRFVEQRGLGDCTIAVLAMYTGLTYEDVLYAASQVSKAPHRKGMYLNQIMATAEILGRPLKVCRKFDWSEDSGILDLTCCRGKAHRPHVALLRWCLIFDTDGEVWEPEAYLANYKAKAKALLKDDV